MTRQPCPNETELLAFADVELSPERLRRIEQHLEACSACARQVLALTRLVEDLAAPVAPAAVDVREHVRAVMSRLEEPVLSRRPVLAVWTAAAVSLLAAAAALLVSSASSDEPEFRGELAARGGPGEYTLSRDVGVQLYTQAPELRPLSAGSRIGARSPLTASLRNAGSKPAYLLLFAIDASGAVHWIAPEFTLPGTNPHAVSLPPAAEERLLPTSAVFDDLAVGPLRVVALLSTEPGRVSDVETLTAEQLQRESLTQRFPRAEVRELVVQVIPGAP